MARYLSAKWFEEVNAAAGQLPSAEVTVPARLTLQQLVTGGPDGDVRYWVRMAGGTVEAGLGEAESPDATISQSYDTAVAVVRGQTRVQTALMSGDIRVSGDVATLVDHHESLQSLDAALADVRRRTTYR